MLPERPPAAQAALFRGRAAEQAGRLSEARRDFEYAQRLAPDDREITFAIGMVRLRQQDPLAAEPFELLARRDNLREAWLCLVKVRMLAGDSAAAATELDQLLQLHAPPSQAGVADFCADVAIAAGRPGWCGLGGAGVLQIGLRPGLKPSGLRIRLDQEKLRPPRPDGDAIMRIALPPRWREAACLHVAHTAGSLLGGAIQVGAIARVEGFVTTRDGGLEGWLWQPGDPEIDPEVTLDAVGGGETMTLTARDVTSGPAMTRPRTFRFDLAELARFPGSVRVIGPDGRNLYGSPLDPGMERRSARAAVASVRSLYPATSSQATFSWAGDVPAAPSPAFAVPADIVGIHQPADIVGINHPAGIVGIDHPGSPRPADVKRPRGLAVVIPVYRGLAATMACLDSVLGSLEPGVRVLVIDDASPDAELVTALRTLADGGGITLHRQTANAGFPAAANAGIRLAGDADVVLLNSDTLCPPGWLARLRKAAASAPDIGTGTPLSNDATIVSYPSTEQTNPVPDLAETIRLDALAAACCAGEVVDVPTGVGFCLYISRDCLEQVGLLREDVFAQGYGEENDFCIRARHLGWRNVAVPGVFVGHVGGQSFGAAKAQLIERNLRVMNRLHPGYEALVHDWQRRDPLRDARRRIDTARWHAAERSGAVILVTHDREGGVRKHLRERAAALRAAGVQPILLSPTAVSGRQACQVADDSGALYPSLVFELPDQLDTLAALLRPARPSLVEVHHTIGHDRAILRLPALLGVPYDVVLHDYSWICPRINLVGAERRYCGEPAVDVCETCYADLGGTTGETIRPTDLLRRSAAELGGARRLLAPSADLARRLPRHLPGLRPKVMPFEDDAALPALTPSRRPTGSPIRVAVVGAIGIEKGYDLLLACARDARSRSLALEFVLVGHSCGDQRLQDAGVAVTGIYDDPEAMRLIRAEQADLAFLPSVWPETWSYTLGQAWRAGLPVVAYAIGAPADRIRATGRGAVLPFGISPSMTNNALLAAGQQWRANGTEIAAAE